MKHLRKANIADAPPACLESSVASDPSGAEKRQLCLKTAELMDSLVAAREAGISYSVFTAFFDATADEQRLSPPVRKMISDMAKTIYEIDLDLAPYLVRKFKSSCNEYWLLH